MSLKIKTKLRYGIGLLFAMIVLLGGLSVKNISALFTPDAGCAGTN